MNKFYLLLLLFTNINIAAYNQVIKGTIIDRKTDSVICFASVYFDGTFVGTQSDRNGNFELDISNNSLMPLTISCVGYNSVTQYVASTNKPLKIYLTPKTIIVSGAVILSKSLVRQRKNNLLLFKSIFLGTTANAKFCLIINENDVTFNYDSDQDTLKAYASNPLIIYNKALGYKITYYLDKFEYYKKDSSFFYKGSNIFNQDLIHDETHKQLYQRRREMAYLGSRMHFFRTLWANNLTLAGYSVKDSVSENLNCENIVIQDSTSLPGPLDSSTKFLAWKNNLQIYYYSTLSKIVFLKPKVYFDKNGYFDQLGIAWEGEMAVQRIGDMLPYDY